MTCPSTRIGVDECVAVGYSLRNFSRGDRSGGRAGSIVSGFSSEAKNPSIKRQAKGWTSKNAEEEAAGC
jgi:hypothetical protein